tara:strand:+ start:1550 stop:4789 length:3240 start_codon:yes stop_codon:yes gene_type:complete
MQLRIILLFTFLQCSSLFAQISINEFNSKKSFIDQHGDDVDWVEIFNHSNDTINLGNYYLSDKLNNLSKWQFPNTLILPNEIKIICASGKEDFKTPSHWESVILPENNWKYFLGNNPPPENWNQPNFNDQNWNTGIGGFGYGDNDDNTIISSVSSIYLRKEFQIIDLNDISHFLIHADYDDGFIAFLNGQEIMRSNNFNNLSPEFNEFTYSAHEAVLYSGGIPESQFFDNEDISEWLINGTNVFAVQVHNADANSSDMSSNFFFSVGVVSNNFNYQPLPNWIITPEIYTHSNFKLSSQETIVISDSNLNIIDSISIPNDITNQISMGRSPDGTGSWCYFDNPSPNLSNSQNICYGGVTPTPSVNFNSGWYQSPIEITVNSPSNTVTYYTTNGDIPDQNDPVLNSSVLINTNSVLSIRSFDINNQLIPSKTIDRTFIFNETNHNLPVFSIITDENNLWDWNTGIYVMGPNATAEYPFFGSNFWEPWSKKSRMEYFDEFQNKQFEAEFDLEIHGGWSRAQPQKSFRIDTKSRYTGKINYPLIKEKPDLTEYNNFNLRNGGQHNWTDRIQDAFINRLAISSHNDRMGYQPCIVYLNGNYWGLYGIREKIDEHYVEMNHGINSNNVDLLNKDSALAGSSRHFEETFDLIQNTEANDTSFMKLFSGRFDLNNYIDYFIYQTYIQNTDWLGIAWELNNVKLWRPNSLNGKWRYVLYDTDAGFGYFGQSVYENYINYARNPTAPNLHSIIFNKSLQNNDFRCRFTNRYNDLINTTFQQNNFSQKINALKNEIQNAIPDHINRWSDQVTPVDYYEWHNAVNSIVNFNELRINTARSHLNQSLSLEGEKEVSLNVFPIESGNIQINSIEPNSLPWTGIYHGGCPVSITATPADGYIFSHWDKNNLTEDFINHNSLTVNLDGNYQFIANFVTCENAVNLQILESNNLVTPIFSNKEKNLSYQWFANERPISNDSLIYNPSNGVYQLIINFDSCEVKSNLLIVNNENYNLDVFPNPANEQVNIHFVLSLIQDIQISIVNSLGKVVYEEFLNEFVGQYNKKIEFSNFAKDTYFVKLITENSIYIEKIIVFR